MALATLSRTLGSRLPCAAVRPALVNRSRPLLVRAFKENEKEPAQQKQEMSSKAPAIAEQQPNKDVVARTPLAYDVMPLRRMTDVMAQMQREMDAMMDMFGVGSDFGFGSRSPAASPFAMLERVAPRAGPAFGRMVPYEMSEDDGKYSLKLEVPGFAKGDIKVNLDPSSNMITITGQKEAKEGESQSRMSFSRCFTLPQNVDFNAEIKARTEHGVLTLDLPKAPEPATPPVKEIPVEGH